MSKYIIISDDDFNIIKDRSSYFNKLGSENFNKNLEKFVPNNILKLLTTYLNLINKIIKYYYNITGKFSKNIIINYGLSGTALYRISNELDNISLLFNKTLYCIYIKYDINLSNNYNIKNISDKINSYNIEEILECFLLNYKRYCNNILLVIKSINNLIKKFKEYLPTDYNKNQVKDFIK